MGKSCTFDFNINYIFHQLILAVKLFTVGLFILTKGKSGKKKQKMAEVEVEIEARKTISDVGSRVKTRERGWKIGVEESLFLVGDLGKAWASLLSIKSTGGRFQWGLQ